MVDSGSSMCNYRGVRRSLVRAAPRAPASPVTSNGGAIEAGSRLVWTGGSEWPTAPTVATPATVLGLPAAWRAANLIAGTVCQLPLVDRADDGTPWPTRPVLDDPWPMMGRSEWLRYQTHAWMMLGDAMAIPADFDTDGLARQLVPIDPRYVMVRVDDQTGRVVYDVWTASGLVTLSRSDVWHAKGLVLTSDGLRGIGVVSAMRGALTNALDLQRYGASVYGAGVPSGIVKVHLREVAQEQADGIKADWQTAFRDRVPAVLSELMDFTPIAWTPEDAQYLESKRFSVAEIAMAFNLDPTDLDTTLGSSMTYANREQRAYERLLTSIGPILSSFEQAYRFVLPRQHHATFDRSVVLWSDAATRATVDTAELANGSVTLNEVRVRNGRPPYGAWADEPLAKPPGATPAPALPPPLDAPPPEPPAPALTSGGGP